MASSPIFEQAGGLPSEPFAASPGLNGYLSGAQEFIKSSLAPYVDNIDPQFQSIVSYVLMNDSAKRLRSTLALIAGEALGTTREDVVDLAAGVETFHNVSLIYDDMPDQDDSPDRRGKPTAHLVFGERRTRNAALTMLNGAYRFVAQADSQHHLNGALSLYAHDIIDGLCLGQDKDLDTFQTAAGQATTLEDLDEIAHLKTGLFVELSTLGVAIIKDAPDEVRKSLSEYSLQCGLAFQINNDLLDPDKSGDGVGNDARHNKPSYVSLLGVEAARAKLHLHAQLAKAAVETLAPTIDATRLKQVVDYIVSQAFEEH